MRTLGGLRPDQVGPDRRPTVDERAVIARLVIGGAVLPAPPDDAEPLEGQGPHRGVMPLPPPALAARSSCAPTLNTGWSGGRTRGPFGARRWAPPSANAPCSAAHCAGSPARCR